MNTSPPKALIEKVVIWIGAAALSLLGLLICASVVLRMTGAVIKGNGEIGEALIIIVAAASLLAATFSGAHPYVHMLVDRLSPLLRGRMAALVGLVAAGFWGTVAVMNAKIAIENSALIEETELLHISLTPFRWLWIIALISIAGELTIRALLSWRSAREK